MTKIKTLCEGAVVSLASVDRPVLLAGLIAGAGLLLALLCAAGAP